MIFLPKEKNFYFTQNVSLNSSESNPILIHSSLGRNYDSKDILRRKWWKWVRVVIIIHLNKRRHDVMTEDNILHATKEGWVLLKTYPFSPTTKRVQEMKNNHRVAYHHELYSHSQSQTSCQDDDFDVPTRRTIVMISVFICHRSRENPRARRRAWFYNFVTSWH